MRLVTAREARTNLDAAIVARGASHAEASKVLRRAPNYVGRHIRDGIPAALSDHDARLLADYLGVNARRLGVDLHPPKRIDTRPWWRKPMPA